MNVTVTAVLGYTLHATHYYRIRIHLQTAAVH